MAKPATPDHPMPARHDGLWLLAVFLLTAFAYWLHGLDGTLTRDDAINIYMAQQWADHGLLPYQSAFIHQGPGAALFTLAALLPGRWLGMTDDILAIRLVSWLLLSAAHLPLFLCILRITGSRSSALLGTAVFISFWGFGVHLIAGPNTKSWSTMLMIVHFWLMLERRWLAAGFTASLATLTWQPMGALAAAGFAICLLECLPARQGWRAIARHAAGLLLPWAIVLAFFHRHDALDALWDGMVRFNLAYVGSHEDPAGVRWLRFRNAVLGGFKWAALFLPVGLLAAIGFAAWGLRQGRSPVRMPALLLLTVLLPVAWTWLDFQSYPDFFVFLPYAAIGCGIAAHAACRRPAVLGSLATLVFVLACLAYQSPFVSLWTKSRHHLHQQRQMAQALPLGPEDTLLSLGDTATLAILGKTNLSRHLQFNATLLAHIEHTFPGGLDGWLAMVEQRAPKVILNGYLADIIPGERFQALLETHYTRSSEPGPWVFIRKD